MKEIIIIGIEKIFKNGVYVMSKFWKIIVRVFRVGRVSYKRVTIYYFISCSDSNLIHLIIYTHSHYIIISDSIKYI